MSNNIDIEKYKHDGYIEIEKFWDKELIDAFLKTFHDILLMQCKKINLKQNFDTPESIEGKIESIISNLNKVYPPAIDFANQMLRETQAGMKIMVYDKLILHLTTLLECPEEIVKIHMDGILVNIPSSSNRLYKYHSEVHYYPKRRNFINIWAPLIRNKNIENGSMRIVKKSHKKHWYINEYQGYSNDSLDNSDYLVQFEVPDNEFEDLEKIDIELAPRDIMFFDKNLLHTSNPNISEKPSYAMVIRAYDYRNDLTLSDNTGDLPYKYRERSGLPSGYPGMTSGK